MNLIPVIREALGLQENEEFHIRFDEDYVSFSKFRFTKECIEEEEIYENGWFKTEEFVLNKLINGEYEVVKLPWEPKESGTYNYVNFYNGQIVQTIYVENCISDKTRVESGNCYRTEEEAKKHVDEWMTKVYGKDWRELLK